MCADAGLLCQPEEDLQVELDRLRGEVQELEGDNEHLHEEVERASEENAVLREGP